MVMLTVLRMIQVSVYQPAHEILALFVSASSQGSGETALERKLTSAFAARTHKILS